MAAPDATQAALVASASAVITVIVSGWINSTSSDRRDAANARREADKDAKHDLEMCQITCEKLKERNADLRSELSLYRGLLAANDIQVPKRSDE